MSEVVLITGCSTGIGRDLARRLAESGYQVVTTARKLETLDDLPVALKLALDVTQPASIQQAVAATLQRFGRIDVLINNAGYALRGAIEDVPVEQARQMFETNLWGAMGMIQAVVPGMRAQKAGLIINVSSIVGRLSFPANGIYSASKFALEALSDALRLELAPFGIRVVMVEPGSIKTSFAEKAQAGTRLVFADPATSPYQPLYQQSEQVTVSMRNNEAGPEVVSRVILQAIQAAHPKARYLAGVAFSGKLVISLRDFAWDLVLRQMFKITLPGKPR